jgi:hypothetical protein
VAAVDLLHKLRADGLVLSVAAGALCVTPRSALTDEHRSAIRAHRDDLVALLTETTPEPEPRFRAWRVRQADGRSGGIVMDPAGMARAEALAAVDRWPGCTVEPLPASRVEGSPC